MKRRKVCRWSRFKNPDDREEWLEAASANLHFMVMAGIDKFETRMLQQNMSEALPSQIVTRIADDESRGQ